MKEIRVLIIKPHHFLDFLYDLSINYRHEGEVNVNHNNNAALCCDFMDGKTPIIIFTPFVDDVCRPCRKLIENKCIDIFDPFTTKKYSTSSKNDFNYQIDIKLNKALPDIFAFNKEQNIVNVLKELKAHLSNEIINLYLWDRENRCANTFIGIDKAIKIYSK